MSDTQTAPVAKSKPWYQSKTLWFNVLVGAGSTIAQASGIDVASLSAVIIPAVSAINVILRTITKKPVALTA